MSDTLRNLVFLALDNARENGYSIGPSSLEAASILDQDADVAKFFGIEHELPGIHERKYIVEVEALVDEWKASHKETAGDPWARIAPKVLLVLMKTRLKLEKEIFYQRTLSIQDVMRLVEHFIFEQTSFGTGITFEKFKECTYRVYGGHDSRQISKNDALALIDLTMDLVRALKKDALLKNLNK